MSFWELEARQAWYRWRRRPMNLKKVPKDSITLQQQSKHAILATCADLQNLHRLANTSFIISEKTQKVSVITVLVRKQGNFKIAAINRILIDCITLCIQSSSFLAILFHFVHYLLLWWPSFLSSFQKIPSEWRRPSILHESCI